MRLQNYKQSVLGKDTEATDLISPFRLCAIYKGIVNGENGALGITKTNNTPNILKHHLSVFEVVKTLFLLVFYTQSYCKSLKATLYVFSIFDSHGTFIFDYTFKVKNNIICNTLRKARVRGIVEALSHS